MGVYINGMEMPQAPERCRAYMDFRIWHDGTVEARIGPKETEYKAVPVPAHGRLVDMDTIEERIDSCCNDIDCSKTMCNECAVQIVMNKVSDAPTIIPAEEGEA